MLDFEERIKLLEAQKDLLPSLRLDTIKLCGILQLSDSAKTSVGLLLEYVINNHLINTELTMLQAFQISLCWTAASLLKEKVNHKESLACAKKYLNFNCQKDEADYVYAMLQCLKSKLLITAQFKAAESPKLAESSCRDHLKDLLNAKVSHSATCTFQKVTSDNGSSSLNQEYIAQSDVSKSIKQIQKKFQKKMKKYDDKLLKRKKEIRRSYIEEKENLESKHKIESDVIRTCSWRYILLRTDKCKMWEIEHAKEVEDLKHQLELRLEQLKELQLEAASKLQKKENKWMEALKRWVHDELLYRQSLGELESADKSAKQVTDKAVACSGHITGTPAWPIASSALDTMTSESCLFADVMGQNNIFKSFHDQENMVLVNSGAKDLINIGGSSDNVEVLLDVTENFYSTAALTKDIISDLPSFDKCLNNINPLPVSDVDVEVVGMVNSVDGPQGPLPLNLTSLEQNPNGAAIIISDREAPVGLHESIRTSHDLSKVVSEIPTSCEEQVRVINPVTLQDKEVETGEQVIFDDLENLVSLDLPSSEEQVLKSATEKENSEMHETISSGHDFQNVASMILPSSAKQNPVMSIATVQDKGAEVGVLDYACLGEDHRNHVSIHSCSYEEETIESSVGKENSEVQVLASDDATQVNQQNLVDSAVNGNSHQEMPLECSSTVQPLIAFVLDESLRTHQADCELLQNELERLDREREEMFKSHQDEKLQMISDMEKGINEVKAEMCQEYETKLQHIEAEFFQKKGDLLAIHKKVLFHKRLARASFLSFKSSDMVVTGSSSSGVHHDGNLTADQQLVQSSTQQIAQMPSLLSNSSPANPPVARQQTTPLVIATSPESAAPLTHSVDLLPIPFLSSTNPESHTHIGTFSASTGRSQGRVEICSPLQLLQPFGPSTSISRSFSQEDASSQQSHRNSPLSSLLGLFLAQPSVCTQISIPNNMQHDHEIAGEPSVSITGTGPDNQPCGVASSQQSQRNIPPSSLSLSPHTGGSLDPTQQFVPDNVVHHPDTAGGLPALRSASALELLIDMSYQCTGRRHSTQNSSRQEQSSGFRDVVCLSDDD